MRWLLLKDLQILRRSPLLVGLLIVYPIAISVLIGVAISRAPEKPKVAIFSQLTAAGADTEISLGGTDIDVSKYSDQLYEAVDPIRVKTREEAREKVESGEALAALIIPEDLVQKLQTGLERPTVEVLYNTEDPVKAQFVEDTIKAQLADANQALSRKFTELAAEYLDLLLKGGSFDVFGQQLEILGLERSKQAVDAAIAQLPPGAVRDGLVGVATFAQLAIQNLSLSDDVLGTVAEPIAVKKEVVSGTRTPLDAFAVAVAITVSLMFITVLLAGGVLALEREEHAFMRLVRGLVSRTGLLVEKIGLAALCGALVTLIMLVGIGLFVELDWSRFGLWLVALLGGALGFGALGVAIGALSREVRAASLMAFLLSLPIAFLALVPSGAVSSGLYDVIQVISAIFPFKPALQAMNAALNDADPGIWVALGHLAILVVAFGVIGRLALRRLAT